MNHKHKCFKELNKELEQHNTKLVGNLLGIDYVLVETEKIETKKRGRPKSVIASYCPFCGKKLTHKNLLKG